MTFRSIITFSALLLAASLSGAQDKPVVKKVPMKQTSPASGKEMYTQYCAACHGTDGKGGGPAAVALKTPPADLTTLAKRAEGGKYPSDRVATILRTGTGVAAHGSAEMPMWGPLFRSMDAGHEDTVQQRISNLNGYLKSLQTP